MNEYYTAQNDYRQYISHHGVKGMHWGIRRYQNPDGTLTEAGKKKYSEDAFRYEQLKKKKMKTLSNEELAFLNERARLKEERGNHGVRKVLKQYGKTVLKTAIVAGVVYAGGKYISKNVSIEDISAKVAKGLSQASVDLTKGTAKGVAETVSKTSKEIYSAGEQKLRQARREAANSNFGRAYVNAVNRALGR